MKIDLIKRAFFEAVCFPPRISLPDWVERNIFLSARACPNPGPSIWHISVMKAARTGYTKTIMAVIGHYAANELSGHAVGSD